MHAMKNNPRGNRHTLLNRLVLARLRTNRLFELVGPDTLYERPVAERVGCNKWNEHFQAAST